jgi:hypothetical protein
MIVIFVVGMILLGAAAIAAFAWIFFRQFFRLCPKCHASMNRTVRVISPVSHYTAGTSERRFDCPRCHHVITETYVVPTSVLDDA